MKRNFYGIPQGSIFALLIFNNFPCHLFSFLDGIRAASYGDDIIFCKSNTKKGFTYKRTKEMEHFSKAFFQLFDFNDMKINSGKSQFTFF